MLKEIWQNKEIRVFTRQFVNTFILSLISLLISLDPAEVGVLVIVGVPLLNMTTKYINKNFLKDIGVEKK